MATWPDWPTDHVAAETSQDATPVSESKETFSFNLNFQVTKWVHFYTQKSHNSWGLLSAKLYLTDFEKGIRTPSAAERARVLGDADSITICVDLQHFWFVIWTLEPSLIVQFGTFGGKTSPCELVMRMSSGGTRSKTAQIWNAGRPVSFLEHVPSTVAKRHLELFR